MTKLPIVCYLDDNYDLILSDYLSKKYKQSYCEIKVLPTYGYKDLINKIVEKNCDILIIDSLLYKNSDKVESKLTGQQLELLLMNSYPAILTIIVSQNEDLLGYNYVFKYNSRIQRGMSETEYYDKNLGCIIDFYLNKICRMNSVNNNEIKDNEGIDTLLKEMIECELNKTPKYDLSKKDVDRLIEKFQRIEEYVNKQK